MSYLGDTVLATTVEMRNAMSPQRDEPEDDPRRSMRSALLYPALSGVVLYLLTVLAIDGPRLLTRGGQSSSRRGVEVILTIEHSQAFAIVGVLSGLVIALAVVARGVSDSVSNGTRPEAVSLAVIRSRHLGIAAYVIACLAVYVGVAGAVHDAPQSWSIVTVPLLLAVLAVCVIAADLVVATKSNPVIATALRVQRVDTPRIKRSGRLKGGLARIMVTNRVIRRCRRA
ncbi:MAG: hypothetical protein INR66_26305 [Gordonia polyisoprenivorans]|nr:hypothetical protein [Gordonia polyisoprenivorans]